MSTLRLEVLKRTHKHLLKGFENQEESLVVYLKRFALRHAERDLLSKTYLAIDEHEGEERLAGYFSLTTVSVQRASLSSVEALQGLPRFPVPGVLLSRLAIDHRVQGQGLGRYLFDEALKITLTLTQSGPITFRLFVTDAISEAAVSFYHQFGFVRLSDELPARMVLDLKTILALREGDER